jgi:hypothetical protein
MRNPAIRKLSLAIVMISMARGIALAHAGANSITLDRGYAVCTPTYL